jgi:GT2 family glycosyltransferase
MNLSYAVITVCLNAGKTIGDTLRSVFSQTPPPRQVILVDGGSQDDTLDRIEEARACHPAAADSALRLETQRHTVGSAGIPAAWNQALRRVVEEDVVFILNADDWYEPRAAAVVLQAFVDHPEIDIVTSPIQYCHAPGTAVLRTQAPHSLRWLPIRMPIPHPGCFVRRRVYDRIGPFSEDYAISADYEFVYRAARAGCRFHTLAEAVVCMRPGGLARRRLALARRETFRIARRHGAGFLLPGAAFLARWLLNR